MVRGSADRGRHRAPVSATTATRHRFDKFPHQTLTNYIHAAAAVFKRYILILLSATEDPAKLFLFLFGHIQ